MLLLAVLLTAPSSSYLPHMNLIQLFVGRDSSYKQPIPKTKTKQVRSVGPSSHLAQSVYLEKIPSPGFYAFLKVEF